MYGADNLRYTIGNDMSIKGTRMEKITINNRSRKSMARYKNVEES